MGSSRCMDSERDWGPIDAERDCGCWDPEREKGCCEAAREPGFEDDSVRACDWLRDCDLVWVGVGVGVVI